MIHSPPSSAGSGQICPPNQNQIFICPKESTFYSQCLEQLVFKHDAWAEPVVEFGSGDGSPVIQALLRSDFNGVIHGYELNQTAYETAIARIHQHQLANQYLIHPYSFFTPHPPPAACLIANPPYLPAPDADIALPLLHGGTDGAQISNQLLSLGYPQALLMISSYSNPVATIDHALGQGYYVADFFLAPLKFGYYSSEAKVKQWLQKLRRQGKAFFSEHEIYILAGVLFRQHQPPAIDLASELIEILTSL